MSTNITWPQLKSRMTQYMVPAGSGVFTVNTAKERKEWLQKCLFGQTENVDEIWHESLNQLPLASDVNLLGISSDCGGGILRGANWGPLFLRQALLQSGEELTHFDLGDIRVVPHLLHDKYLNEQTISHCRQSLYGDQDNQLPVSPLSIAEDFTEKFYELFPGKGIFSIGGDHSVSYPIVKSYLKAKAKRGIKVGLIHFDAHTDLLTERLGIDLCFGSWTTHVLEYLNDPSLCVQIGIRSTGKSKSHWESTFGVKQYWAKDVKDLGAQSVCDQIIEHYKKAGVQEIYVSFDIDAIDSAYASATGTPEENGLTPDQPMTILQNLYEQFPITGADMVEIAPFLNTNPKVSEPDTTLAVASGISTFLIQAISQMNRKR